MLPRRVFGGCITLLLVPPDARKGGCCMEWGMMCSSCSSSLAAQSLAMFQISWAIFKEIHNNKKLPPSVSKREWSFLLTC